jgi:hypothetical protein
VNILTEQVKQEEKYPVDETIQVIEGTTIYKNNKWWFAVLLANSFGHNKVMVYQWQYVEKKRNENGQWVGTGEFHWKRKQKIGFNFTKDWDKAKLVIDEYMKKGGL